MRTTTTVIHCYTTEPPFFPNVFKAFWTEGQPGIRLQATASDHELNMFLDRADISSLRDMLNELLEDLRV